MIFDKKDRTTRLSVGQRIAAFWKHPNREHEMTVNRLVISALILAYLIVSALQDVPDTFEPLVIIVLYSAASLALLWHILRQPDASPKRRVADASPWLNSSKIRGSASAEIPSPVSLTTISITPVAVPVAVMRI